MAHVTHFEAQKMLSEGAILIDIREPGETAREYIKDAILWPLSKMPNQLPVLKNEQQVIFFCRSGNRTIMNDQKLNDVLPNNAYI